MTTEQIKAMQKENAQLKADCAYLRTTINHMLAMVKGLDNLRLSR